MRIDSLELREANGLIPAGLRDFWTLRAGQMISAQGANRIDSMGRFQPRHDAAESAFTQKALTYINEELFPTLIPPLEARTFGAPTVMEGNPGDATYLWRKPTRTGMARFFAPGAALSLPTVGAFIDEISTPYYTIGCQLSYDYFELLAIGAAAANGQKFDGIKEKLIAALEANEKKLDLIAAFGTASPGSFGIERDVDLGLTGLLNNANASQYTTPAGASGSKAWVNKTADEVLADLFGIVSYQISSTYKVHVPNTMLLPISEFQAIANRRVNEASDDTILSFFMKNQERIGQPIKVYSWSYLTGIGAASSDRMIVFNRDPRMVRHPLSTDKAQLPAETHGLTTRQVVYSRTPGVIMFRPLSVTFADYIG